jgi:hypothetical protein
MKLLCTTVLTVSRVKVQSFSLCEYMTDGAEGRDTVVSGSLKQQPGQGYAPEAIPYGDGAAIHETKPKRCTAPERIHAL